MLLLQLQLAAAARTVWPTEQAAQQQKGYLFPEVDGNIGDRQRHQKAEERPVRTEGWKLHHSTSRGDRATGICLGLIDWKENRRWAAGKAEEAAVFSSDDER